LRLTELAHQYGAVSEKRYQRFSEVRRRFEQCKSVLEDVKMSLNEWSKHLPQIGPGNKGKFSNIIIF
jgi:tRNA U34 5-carboxymethylaminomethyl modifying enzyme MnmG/GidA